MLRALAELLLPAACARCGGDVPGAAALCPGCDALLPRLAQPLDPRPPPPLAAVVAAAAFAGEAEAWIRRFKYPAPGLAGLDPRPGSVVRALAREAAARLPCAPDVVVPVPQHPRRLRARGFSPTALLAREVSRALDLPLLPAALVRTRDTPSQTGLQRAARARNVAGAFRPARALEGVVALVDDVTTTGATLAEAARALRRAGARRVVAVCAARTL